VEQETNLDYVWGGFLGGFTSKKTRFVLQYALAVTSVIIESMGVGSSS